jgi:AcrR family transcriptional regulator
MLNAAEEFLKGGDSRRVTVENVTTLSGVKVSSFYARFENVEGLFQALRDPYREVVYQTTILRAHEKAFQQTDLRSAPYQFVKPTLELACQEHVAISFFPRNPTVGQIEIINQRKFMVDSTLEILQKNREEIKKGPSTRK